MYLCSLIILPDYNSENTYEVYANIMLTMRSIEKNLNGADKKETYFFMIRVIELRKELMEFYRFKIHTIYFILIK